MTSLKLVDAFLLTLSVSAVLRAVTLTWCGSWLSWLLGSSSSPSDILGLINLDNEFRVRYHSSDQAQEGHQVVLCFAARSGHCLQILALFSLLWLFGFVSFSMRLFSRSLLPLHLTFFNFRFLVYFYYFTVLLKLELVCF